MADVLLIALILLGAGGMGLLIRWARRGGKAALLAAAAMFGFIADPTAERQLRMVQESRQEKAEEEPSGEPPSE